MRICDKCKNKDKLAEFKVLLDETDYQEDVDLCQECYHELLKWCGYRGVQA